MIQLIFISVAELLYHATGKFTPELLYIVLANFIES